jgi:hypothetical protein
MISRRALLLGSTAIVGTASAKAAPPAGGDFTSSTDFLSRAELAAIEKDWMTLSLERPQLEGWITHTISWDDGGPPIEED